MELAVIKTGGKQYVVKKGDLVTIEKLGRGSATQVLKQGDPITFDEVLMRDDGKTATVGMPIVAGAIVMGTVHSVGRLPKIEVMKYKAKSRYMKRRGHRQPFVKVKIDSIK